MFKLHTEDWLDLGEFLDSLSYLCGAPKDEKQRKVPPPSLLTARIKPRKTSGRLPFQPVPQTLPRRTLFCLDELVIKELP